MQCLNVAVFFSILCCSVSVRTSDDSPLQKRPRADAIYLSSQNDLEGIDRSSKDLRISCPEPQFPGHIIRTGLDFVQSSIDALGPVWRGTGAQSSTAARMTNADVKTFSNRSPRAANFGSMSPRPGVSPKFNGVVPAFRVPRGVQEVEAEKSPLRGTSSLFGSPREESSQERDPRRDSVFPPPMLSDGVELQLPEADSPPLFSLNDGEKSSDSMHAGFREEIVQDLSTEVWFKLKLPQRETPTPNFLAEKDAFEIDDASDREETIRNLWGTLQGMPLPGMPEMKVEKYLGAGAFGTVLLVDITKMSEEKPEWFQKLTALMGCGEEGVGSNEKVLMVIKLMNYNYGKVGRDGKNTIETSAQEEITGLQALKKVQSGIPVKGFGEIEFLNGKGILMEYIPGVSMFDALNRHAVTFYEKMALIPSMFRGLAAMHEAGVYWGDLKHENLMLQDLQPSEVGPNGLKHRLRFIDMGLSTVFNEGEECKGGNCPSKGSPGFVPWNLVFEPRLVATRANFDYIDVFAAAVEAMVMLQGPPNEDALGADAVVHALSNVIQNEALRELYSSRVFGDNKKYSFLQPFYEELILPLSRNDIITADQVIKALGETECEGRKEGEPKA